MHVHPERDERQLATTIGGGMCIQCMDVIQDIKWAPPIMTPTALAFPVYNLGLKPPAYTRVGSLGARLGTVPPPLPPQTLARFGFPTLAAESASLVPSTPMAFGGGARLPSGSVQSAAGTLSSSVAPSPATSSAAVSEIRAARTSLSSGYESVDSVDADRLESRSGDGRRALLTRKRGAPQRGRPGPPSDAQEAPAVAAERLWDGIVAKVPAGVLGALRVGPRGERGDDGGRYRSGGRDITGASGGTRAGPTSRQGMARSGDSSPVHSHPLGLLDTGSSFDVGLAPPPFVRDAQFSLSRTSE